MTGRVPSAGRGECHPQRSAMRDQPLISLTSYNTFQLGRGIRGARRVIVGYRITLLLLSPPNRSIIFLETIFPPVVILYKRIQEILEN